MKLFISSKAFKQAVISEVNSTLKSLPQIAPGRFLFPFYNSINANVLQPSYDSARPLNSALTSVDVFSVVSRIAESTAAVPLLKYRKTKDKKAFRNYVQKSILDVGKELYKIKALEELDDTDPLAELFYNTDGRLSEREFLLSVILLYLIDGEVNIYKRKTGATRGSRVISMHIFTKSDTAIAISGGFPYKIEGYVFSYAGREILKGVPPEDVIQIKNPSLAYNIDGSHLRGLSKLSIGRKLVESMDVTEQRRRGTIKNGSLPGLISLEGGDEAPPWDIWRRDYQTFIEDASNANVPFPIAGKVNYVETGLKSIDLQLMENEALNFKKLCNLYHVSTIMFNSDVAATESNVGQMMTAFYTNACIPVADAVQDAFNRDPDISEKGTKYVAFDFTSVQALQKDLQKLMTAVAAMPVSLTGNQIFELWGYEKSPLAEMDKPLLKQGYGFIDDHINLPDPMSGLDPNA